MGSPFCWTYAGRACVCIWLFLVLVSGTVFSQTAVPQTVAPASPVQITPADVSSTNGSAQPTNQSSNVRPAPQRAIRIGAGDLLEIRVFGVPEMSQDARVSDAGEISVPLIGSVAVAGLTTVEAQKLMETRLRDGGFLRDPQVTVFSKEYASQGVSVMGEVQRPGIYPLLGTRRLYDAISTAGGTTARAGRTVTITHREDPSKFATLEMDTDPSKSPASNVEIYPGDTIIVSRAGVVYVVGDVGRPAGYVMDNNERMTVLQAIALAGGTNGTAALKSAKVLRRSPTGVQEIPMPLNKILSAQAEDVALQPEDVLFVPNSKVKSAGRRSAEAVLAIATGLAVYRR